MYFFKMDTSWGDILILYGPGGVQAVKFLGNGLQPEDFKIELQRRMEKPWPDLRRKLEKYFKGEEKVEFNQFPVSLEGYSPFTVKVLEYIRQVPYGRVCSYQSIAQALGFKNAARPVGRSLGSNPVPVIIPCHRVIKKDGCLGGFSWGLDFKLNLLRLEGVTFTKLGRVSDEIFICR